MEWDVVELEHATAYPLHIEGWLRNYGELRERNRAMRP